MADSVRDCATCLPIGNLKLRRDLGMVVDTSDCDTTAQAAISADEAGRVTCVGEKMGKLWALLF